MIWLIKQAMLPIFPRHAQLPGIADVDLDGFLRRMRRESDALYWAGLVAAAWLFACTPWLTVGIPVPAFLLSRALLSRHSERLASHRWYAIRQAMAVIRLSAGMCWGADPGVRACFRLEPYPADPGTFRNA